VGAGGAGGGGAEDKWDDVEVVPTWGGAESSGKPNVDWATVGFRDDIERSDVMGIRCGGTGGKSMLWRVVETVGYAFMAELNDELFLKLRAACAQQKVLDDLHALYRG